MTGSQDLTRRQEWNLEADPGCPPDLHHHSPPPASRSFPALHAHHAQTVPARSGSDFGAGIVVAKPGFRTRSARISGVLTLNKHYHPVRIVSPRRAFSMVVAGIADILDDSLGDYQTYSFSEWRCFSPELWSRESARQRYNWVRTVSHCYPIPRIVRTLNYGRLPPSTIRLNRANIVLRDHSTCQYCAAVLKPRDVTLDHVIPRSRGGGMSWSNIVCCCMSCNATKGQRTPDEARMPLLREPRMPRMLDLLHGPIDPGVISTWKPFLSHVLDGDL